MYLRQADCEDENKNELLMLVLWVVTPYGLIGGYQSFGETYCLHLQG
jgi:hypothetical protein